MFVLFQSMHGEIGSDQKMKVLVFSDSHGNETNMITAIEQETPDMVLHLGDCWEDVQELRWIYPELAIEQVPGNCDDVPLEELERVIQVAGYRLAFCHGHSRGVKRDQRGIICLGEETGADLVLYGHTHQRHCEKCGRFYLMNPASVGMGSVSYGVLYLEEGQCRGVIKGVFSEEEYYAFAD